MLAYLVEVPLVFDILEAATFQKSVTALKFFSSSLTYMCVPALKVKVGLGMGMDWNGLEISVGTALILYEQH